jgi:hypothetical protein
MMEFIKTHNRLNHVVVALMIMIAVLPLVFWLGPEWIPASVAIGHFFGRERAQYQRWLALKTARRQADVWLQAFLFWNWSRDGQLDFYYPAAVSVLVTVSAKFIWLA